MNFGTAYLDGSGIYGATPESADKLREFDGGFLKVFKTFFSNNHISNKSFVVKLVSLHYYPIVLMINITPYVVEYQHVSATAENIGTMSRLGS